jgi:VanZ family protein
VRQETDLTATDLVIKRSHPNILRAWWPAAVWIGLIAIESTDAFSSRNTGIVLYTLLSRLFAHISLRHFFLLNHYMRKTGHCVGYGMLSVLLLRGWRATLDRDNSQLGRTAIFSWLGTVFVATMDEWHQSYIPSRTGTWQDVVLDSLAGLTFLAVAYWWLRRARGVAAESP